MLAARLISLVIGYVCGLFSTGAVYSKRKEFDLRTHGSGNTGATNTLRTMGVKAGVLVLGGDILKAVIAVTIVRLLYRGTYPNELLLLMIYAGLGTVLGHDFPFYNHFKGGKGMASTVGMIIGAMPILLPIEAAIFLTPVFLTQFVSVGSIIGYFVFPFLVYLALYLGWLSLTSTLWVEAIVIVSAMAILAIYQHRANIKRLIKGEENKFFSKKK